MADLQVSTYTAGNQRAAAIAKDAAGKSIVVWESDEQDGSGVPDAIALCWRGDRDAISFRTFKTTAIGLS